MGERRAPFVNPEVPKGDGPDKAINAAVVKTLAANDDKPAYEQAALVSQEARRVARDQKKATKEKGAAVAPPVVAVVPAPENEKKTS